MRYALPLALIIVLSGCGTTTNYYSETVQSWKGAKVAALTKQWGRPDNMVKTTNGNTIYVYKTESYKHYNGPTGPSTGISYTADGKPVVVTRTEMSTSFSRDLTCNAIFTANSSGQIVGTQASSPTCYGGSGFRDRMSYAGS